MAAMIWIERTDGNGRTERWAGDAGIAADTLSRDLLDLRRLGEERGAALASAAPSSVAAAAQGFLAAVDRPETAVALAADCGMSPEMVREAAANFFPQLTENALGEFVRRSLGGSHPAGARPLAPAVVFHRAAGNLFISAVESVVHALLLGAGSLARCPASGTAAIRLWRDCLAAADPEFARLLALGRWPRERTDLTGIAAAAADAVVAFGSDESVAAVRALTPMGTRFLAHGAKLSFAVIGGEALRRPDAENAQLAAALAYDFTVYDQQGCLSPRAAFLQTKEAETAQRFGLLVAQEMRRLAVRLPPPRLTLEESAALGRARDNAAIDAALGRATSLLSGAGDPFVATLSPAAGYAPGCLNRFADLRMFGEVEELGDALAPLRGAISTVGSADAPWIESVVKRLRVPRICDVGRMQRPQLGWTHDGCAPLTSLCDWTSAPPAVSHIPS